MLLQHTAVVGFFPPSSLRIGETSIHSSFARFLADKCRGPVSVPILEEGFEPPAPHALCLIGLSPVIADLSRAKRLAGQLLAGGISKDRIWMMLWNHGIPGGLPEETFEKHLGGLRAKLPYDLDAVMQAENENCSLRPKAAITVAIERLARDVHQALPSSGTTVGGKVDWLSLEKSLTSRLWTSRRGRHEKEDASVDSISRQIDQELHTFDFDGAPAQSIARLRQNVLDHVTGLGPLEKFLRESAINEIMVNGPSDIFVERDGVIEKTQEAFDSPEQLRTVIDRVVGRMGRRVDASSPLCDARLPDGSRVNVALPPLSLCGPALTIRRFKPLYRRLEDLVRAGTVDPVQAAALRQAIEQRKNIVVAGNSGAGKTTLLNVLADLIPDRERILTLEDAAELQIVKPHVVRLETRPKNAEGLGEVTMSNLLVNALRMRPDRLLIGECRGAEAVPMLQAMNTGHDGSMTTLHANSAEDALKRLESMVLLGAPQWPAAVVREQIVAGVDLVVYLKRAGSERKLLEIRDV